MKQKKGKVKWKKIETHFLLELQIKWWKSPLVDISTRRKTTFVPCIAKKIFFSEDTQNSEEKVFFLSTKQLNNSWKSRRKENPGKIIRKKMKFLSRFQVLKDGDEENKNKKNDEIFN